MRLEKAKSLRSSCEKIRASKRRDDQNVGSPTLIHEIKTSRCRFGIAGDCAFKLHLVEHFAAADGCPGNTLHRSGPTDGNHDIAARLSRPSLCGQTYYVYDNVYYRARYVVGS